MLSFRIIKSVHIHASYCKNWNQFVELFGEKGACGNCWCMYYRLKNTDFKEGKLDDGNRNAMKELVWQNKPNGKLLHRKKIVEPPFLYLPENYRYLQRVTI